MTEEAGREQVLILVKALPRSGDRTGETAFSAGLTADREWRRHAPLPEGKRVRAFSHWQWIAYDWCLADNVTDSAWPDDRNVFPGTVEPGLRMAEKERAGFIEPLVAATPAEAADRGQGLVIVRPHDPLLTWRRKRADRLDTERRAYDVAGDRLAFLNNGRAPEPCPFEFHLQYDLEDGHRDDICLDGQLAALYAEHYKRDGEKPALQMLDETINLDYARHGMACVLAADADQPERWHLVAMLRVAEEAQLALL
jgi:hypothetical protein